MWQCVWWVINHPIQTFKIMVCQHDHIDIDLLRCKWCGKQYRYVSASEYVDKLTD